jgi:hypothetical protein
VRTCSFLFFMSLNILLLETRRMVRIYRCYLMIPRWIHCVYLHSFRHADRESPRHTDTPKMVTFQAQTSHESTTPPSSKLPLHSAFSSPVPLSSPSLSPLSSPSLSPVPSTSPMSSSASLSDNFKVVRTIQKI